MTPLIVIRQKRIVRSDLRNNPHLLYVFGDNVARVGLAGQAKEMRGEPNAFGIATLSPGRPFLDNLDGAARDGRQVLLDDTRSLLFHYQLVWPTDGIGTGLADMPPRLRLWMDKLIKTRFNIVNELKET